MKKLIMIAALFGGTALADDKADQAKVDAAKVDACEKSKKFIADQKAKGKCTAEADEAAKITCTAATSSQVNELFKKCVAAKPADKPADATTVPHCRAIDPADGKTIFDEAEDKLATKCSTLLLDKLKKKWCTAENKGKKFDYTLSFDHMVGKGATAKKMADSKRTWTCRTIVK